MHIQPSSSAQFKLQLPTLSELNAYLAFKLDSQAQLSLSFNLQLLPFFIQPSTRLKTYPAFNKLKLNLKLPMRPIHFDDSSARSLITRNQRINLESSNTSFVRSSSSSFQPRLPRDVRQSSECEIIAGLLAANKSFFVRALRSTAWLINS